jgi:phosphoglycolate phosphatase
MKRIFSDLDGTLIDSRKRLHTLFVSIVPEAAALTFENYWEWKYDGLKHAQILTEKFGYTGQAVGDFEFTWLAEIEKPEWLSLDTLWSSSVTSLRKLRNAGFEIIIVTTRRSKISALEQLKTINLIQETDLVIISEKRINKVQAIRNIFQSFSSEDFFVGDTEEDIQAARELGVSAVAVCSGFRSRSTLSSLSPDYLYNDFSGFADAITKSH